MKGRREGKGDRRRKEGRKGEESEVVGIWEEGGREGKREEGRRQGREEGDSAVEGRRREKKRMREGNK